MSIRAGRVPLIDYELDHSFVGDGAVLSILVGVSTPSFAFSTRIVEAHEPVRIKAFGAKLSLKDSIIRKFLRTDKNYSTTSEEI